MIAVVQRNPEFRRLWFSQMVSQTGDWLNRVAILALVGSLSGPQATIGVGVLFGIEIVIRMLPSALFGPFAGPFADRLPKRKVMVLADLLRCCVVLGYLLVNERGDLPLLYLLLITQMSLSIFFSAARSAAVPETVTKEDLHAALSLSAATWSAMLAVGAALGGFLIAWIGVRGVFLVDALTFVASAALLRNLHLPPVARHPEPMRLYDLLLLKDLGRAYRHVHARNLLWPVLAKAFWGGAGGYLVILSLLARERFTDDHHVEDSSAVGFAVGVLYAARGLGTGIGPWLAARLWGTSDSTLYWQIRFGFLIGAAGYFGLAFIEDLWVAFFVVCCAHTGGSTLWIASTALWQRRVAPEFRGRVFSLEFLGMTLAFSVGGLFAGWFYDYTGNLNHTIWASSIWVLCGGSCWWFLSRANASLRDNSGAASPPESRPASADP